MSNETWNSTRIVLGEADYPYYFGWHCLEHIAHSIGRCEADKFLVVTDDTVLALHGDVLLRGLRAQADVVLLSSPPGEGMKSLRHLSFHLERAIAAGATRRSIVVAFGGGVPGNLGGMLAALLFRGIRLVHVPTTTVAAMDSVLSLKQAINSGYGKNHVGTYYAPIAVYLDLALLQTLPQRELRSGFCEAAKNCLAIRPESLPNLRRILRQGELASPSALEWLLEDSLAAKSAVTALDAKEQRSGLILEYGHTIGHAIELCDHRLRGTAGLSHGEAVAMGFAAAARASLALGKLDRKSARIHSDLLVDLGVPAHLPGLKVSDVIGVVHADNKRGYLAHAPHETAMVLLSELGVPVGEPDLPLISVPLDLIEQVVSEFIGPDSRPANGRLTPGVDPLPARARVVWAEALGIPIDDKTDFFLAGGTSLQAARMLSALEAAWGLRIPLRTLFDNPRFADFLTVATRQLHTMASESFAREHGKQLTSFTI